MNFENRLNYASNMKLVKNESFAVRKIINSAYFKIVINYSQTIAILNSLKLNWNEIIAQYFQIHKMASGSIDQILSIECILYGKFMNFFKTIYITLISNRF